MISVVLPVAVAHTCQVAKVQKAKVTAIKIAIDLYMRILK